MPLILGAQSATGAADVVTNSCRFNDGDAPYMKRTAGTPTDQDKYTFSCWAKRGALSGTRQLLGNEVDGNNREFIVYTNTTDTFTYSIKVSGVETKLVTNAVYRDVSAWYHIVVAYDSGQGVAANRVKIYINGTQKTSFSTETYPAQDLNSILNTSGNEPTVGASWNATSSAPEGHFDGYLAEVCFCDGQAYAASDFGEFDEDSPTIWKPKDVSGLTFGDNGFYLDFEDSANLGADVSGNGNDLTETNIVAADQATDTPSNNFCTGNPLDNYYQNAVWSEGNCNVLIATSAAGYSTCTMGMTAGKWYWEQQGITNTGGFQVLPGIAGRMLTDATEDELGETDDCWGYYSTTGNSYNDSTQTSYGNTYVSGDIIGVAVDLDNNKLYYAKNGVWQNSGVPTSGATGTGAISIMAANLTTMGLYLPAWTGGWGGSVGHYGLWNFGGCSAFALTSAESDGNGYGNFEYAPPSGYLALCTKNLGSDGG